MTILAELGLLLKAEIALPQALILLEKHYGERQTIFWKPHKMSLVIQILRKDLQKGLSLSKAMQKHPRYFDDFTLSLIQMGENTHHLSLACEKIAHYHEKIKIFKKQIKKALYYPMTVAVSTLCIGWGLLMFIVPQFETLFQRTGVALPWATRDLLHAHHWVRQHGLFLGLLNVHCMVLLYGFRKFLGYYLCLCTPFISGVYKKLMMARLSYSLALLLEASLTVTDTLKIAAFSLKAPRYQKALLKARTFIIQGDYFFEAFKKTRAFPAIFLEFIYIGEQSGHLKPLLFRLSAYYESRVDQALHTLTLLLEPLALWLLGLMIGFFMVALYLPIFQLGKTLQY